jgi:cyclopropane-fatty-acyl-phospholipid synthase
MNAGGKQSSGTGVASGASNNASGYQRFLHAALDRHVRQGRIALTTLGTTTVVGRGRAVDVVVRIHNPDFFRKVVCYGNLGLGEAYMAGDFEVEGEQLVEFLTLLLRSDLDKKLKQDLGFALHYVWVRLANLLKSKAANVQRHYDIGEDLFDAFLQDRYQVYSCGYAHRWDDDADTLQHNKLDRICRKLMLQPRHRLLDIGCGKGGLLIHAALNYGICGIGVTNSRAHHQRALENIRKHRLDDRLGVQLGDFSDVQDGFDRVASVGMLEHVPPREVPAYFRKIKSVLRPQGWALVHAIGLNAAKNKHDPFIQKYIFPGSDTPKLSVLALNIEANGLAIVDVENIARHYAVTCRRWLESFRRNRDGLDPSRYDASFKRMWEYYLCCGVAVALAGNLSVYQVLFTNDYHAAYPFQRV